MDEDVWTVRDNRTEYISGESFVTVIDGFLVSSNIEILDVKGIDQGVNSSITRRIARDELPVDPRIGKYYMSSGAPEPTSLMDILQDDKGHEIAVILLEAKMIHHVNKDLEWKKAGLEIQYSGPGKATLMKDQKIVRVIDLYFKEGKISHIQYKKNMIEKPLVLYAKLSNKTKLTAEEAWYQVDNETYAVFEVEAGGRHFKRDKIFFDPGVQKLEIEYNPKKPSSQDIIQFTAVGEDNWYYSWEFGDGKNEAALGMISTNHQYTENKEYEVKVKAYKDAEMTKSAASGRIMLKLEERLDIVFVPGNNLQANPGDTVEIGIKPAKQKLHR